jgi:hypothetical protein
VKILEYLFDYSEEPYYHPGRKRRGVAHLNRQEEEMQEERPVGPDASLPETQLGLWVEEGFPQEVIRSEVNFLVLPFFALSRRDVTGRTKTEYHATVKRGNERLEASWKVSANPEYGYPGPFDRRVHRAIEQIISELRPPLENPIILGSLYHISKLLSLGNSGQAYRDIREAIHRIVATTVESKGTFYSKGTQEWIDDQFHLYDRVVFRGRRLPNGEAADNNYLYLSSWYLESINARYVRPLDYAYHRSLRGEIASRLYELLGVKFYGKGGGVPFIRYRYSTLCDLLPLTRRQYLSKAKEKLTPAHEELIRTGFFANVEWADVPREARDWYVTYWPGPRAREELKRLPRQVTMTTDAPLNTDGDDPRDELESRGSVPFSSKSLKTEEPGEAVNIVRQALQDSGISKGVASKLVKGYAEAHILGKLELVQWLVSTGSPLVAKNPAGWLRRAIEEDYEPPKGYERSRQPEALETRQQKVNQAEADRRRAAESEYRQAKEGAIQQLREQYPPQLIGKEGLTTQSAWDLTLQTLQEQVSVAVYETWLKDTVLLEVTDHAARIAAGTPYKIAWLERRLYQPIASTLREVLKKDLDLQFVTSSLNSD